MRAIAVAVGQKTAGRLFLLYGLWRILPRLTGGAAALLRVFGLLLLLLQLRFFALTDLLVAELDAVVEIEVRRAAHLRHGGEAIECCLLHVCLVVVGAGLFTELHF